MNGDDSPGLTDYPRRDIETHRHIAKWNARFAGAVAFGSIFVASTGSLKVPLSLVLAIAALMYASALSMRIQALRWETQLKDDRDREKRVVER